MYVMVIWSKGGVGAQVASLHGNRKGPGSMSAVFIRICYRYVYTAHPPL